MNPSRKRRVILFSSILLASVTTLLCYFSPQRASTPLLDEQAKKAGKGQNIALSSTSSASFKARRPASISSQNSLLKELFEIEKCLDGGCDYPQTDPRSYELAVYRAIAEKLNSLGDVLESDSREYDQHLQSILHFLEVPDGFVQEAALDLLSHTTPAEESFLALQGMLKNGVDPHISGQIISEFQKYKSDATKRSLIEEELLHSLEWGPISSRLVVADRMLPFIQRGSVEQLKRILVKLPKNSPLAQSVASTIERLAE